MSDILYEPRAIWSVGRIDNSDEARSEQELPLQLRLGGDANTDFMNGEKYDVTLRYMLISAIGYTFDVYGNSAALSAANFRNNRAAVMDFARLTMAVRRKHYLTRRSISSAAWCEVPTGDIPSLDLQGTPPLLGSSVTNLFSWQFDKSMILPRTGTCEFHFTGYPWAGTNYLSSVEPPDEVFARLSFQEVGGARYHGNARYKEIPLFATSQPPFGADGFGAPALANTANLWPPTSQFTPRDFSQQEVSGYGPSSPVVGFQVGLQQLAYDAALSDAAAPAGSAGTIASIGNNIGCRARTAIGQGGTGAWWWRPGAPLCLVTPTQTTARVFPLREPVTLAPGDSLEVVLNVPPVVADVATVYQIGVSFCGEAAITA